jgi:AraC family transcriptional regulator of adaptative response/methylated-DNA-[protein]-cysteine methyltransferase
MNDYENMTKIIRYLAEHAGEQPTLTQLANMTGYSPAYFQRKFTAWVGVSPKSYIQHLTLVNARLLLTQGARIFDVAVDTGLSGLGRLHDLCVTLDAATPGEIKTGGLGLTIHYGFGMTPFGECIIASTPRGICYLAFIQDGDYEAAITGLKRVWPCAVMVHKNEESQNLIMRIFALQHNQHQAPLRVLVKGTNFQLQVWRALLKIPVGRLVTYGDLATYIARPGSARAVGSAVGANQLAYLIPCHRVIRNTGVIGEYRWGSCRKKAIIKCETARKLAP